MTLKTSRAIDRLKDRTGVYVLMGAAADRSSYEASQFAQGLLTYALLKGMKEIFGPCRAAKDARPQEPEARPAN